MLVLTRKLHERITIGEDITVEVVGLDNGRVVLGITAPKEFKILRMPSLKREKE